MNLIETPEIETIIHPTAFVSKLAKIGTGVTIGPNAVVEDDVQIGNDVEIRQGAIIANGARIGNRSKVYAYAVIATEPQDLKYLGEPTNAFIGEDTIIREFATVNRGTTATGRTSVGSNCLIMTYSHVAHDCRVGDNVVISNATQLAGHVTIEDWVGLGGVVKIHQFCTIGKHAFVGADVKIVKDVAPYTLIGREPPQVEGINKIGLRRRGFSHELIAEIEEFYHILLFSGLNNRDGIAKYSQRQSVPEEILECIGFIDKSSRGIYR